MSRWPRSEAGRGLHRQRQRDGAVQRPRHLRHHLRYADADPAVAINAAVRPMQPSS
jgi:hypothetical protein